MQSMHVRLWRRKVHRMSQFSVWRHPVIRASSLQFVGLALGVAAGVLIARVGGAEIKGVFSAYAAATVILGMSINLDYSHQAIVAAREARDPGMVGRALARLWSVYAPAFFALSAAVALIDTSYGLYIVGAAAFTLCSHLNIATSGLVAAHYAALTAAGQQVVILVGTGCLILTSQLDGSTVIYLIIASYVLPIPLLAWKLRALSASEGSVSDRRVPVMSLVRRGIGWQPGRLFQFALMRLDILVVMQVFGSAAAGVYSVGLSLATLTAMAPTQVANYLVYKGARSRLGSIKNLLQMSLFLSITLGAILAVIGLPVITTLYGDGFSRAYGVLLVTLPGAVALGIINVLSNRLRMVEGPRVYTGAMLLGLSTMGLGIVLLGPIYELEGIGVASSLGGLASALALYCLYRRAVSSGAA